MAEIKESWIDKVILCLLVITAVLLLINPVALSPLHIMRNYNEGWNAFWADRAYSALPLYPKITALISNSYPPLSFYIVGAFGKLLHDNIIAGRILALLGFVVTTFSITGIVRLMQGSKWVALFAALIFVNFSAIHFYPFIAVNIPQWLAHAVMMIGFVIFLMSQRQARLRLLCVASFLMVTACLIKHNIIAIPLATTLWLALYHRRHFYVWCIVSAVILALYMTLFYLSYGADFFISVFAMPRAYHSAHVIWRHIVSWAVVYPLLLAAFLLLMVDYKNRYCQLVFFYIIFSFVWGTYASGGYGVAQNIIFDLVIALSIASGLMLNRINQAMKEPAIGAHVQMTLMALIAFAVVIFVPHTMSGRKVSTRIHQQLPSKIRVAKFADAIAYIKAQPGPVWCENLELCYWAGKPFEVDTFNLWQKLKVGAMKPERINKLLEQQYFSVIEPGDRPSFKVLPSEVNNQIQKYYPVVLWVGEKAFLMPGPKTDRSKVAPHHSAPPT